MLLKVLLTIVLLGYSRAQRKNVILIMVDDIGWNDLSYRGSSEIPTYNIDALAYSGIILNNYRTAPMCTPSRSALMTGKYPHHLGMQSFVIQNDEPWGLPLEEKIMPQYFKDAGYVTRVIGKWHLGFFQERYVPTRRGYDSFYGFYGTTVNYWNHTAVVALSGTARGYDMRRNTSVADTKGEYITDLFTEEAVNIIKSHDRSKPLFLVINHLAAHAGSENLPIRAKQEDMDRFSYISSVQRRIQAAVLYQLDKSIGETMKALRENNMLDDSVIMLFSDNGGPTNGISSTSASNHPLRGQKITAWEGGTRVNAIIFDRSLPKNVVRDRMIDVSDWLPTLRTLTGANFAINTKIDGIDQTNMLRNNANLRSEFVFMDDANGYGSYIYNGIKILNGTSLGGLFDGWLGTNNNVNIVDATTYYNNVVQSEAGKALNFALSSATVESLRRSATFKCSQTVRETCNLSRGPCLFNLDVDPCEQNNLAETQRDLLQDMQKRFKASISTLVPNRNQPTDLRSDPRNFNFVWTPWQ